MIDYLSQPLEIHGKTSPNRIAYHPAECNDADGEGNPTELTLERYRKFAEGAPGVIFVEGCTVTWESRGRTNKLGAMRHNTAGLRRIVDTIRAADSSSLILFQITHDGRRSGRFSRVVSVYPAKDPSVELLSTEQIVAIQDMFAESAAVVEQAGGDGIDFKSCNGYLPSDFLDPANDRTDGYGGTFENRTRFFRETVEKIQHKVGSSFILGSRISVMTTPGGFGTRGRSGAEEDLTEFVELARLMEALGMHYVSVHVSNAAYYAKAWVQMPSDKNPLDVFTHFRLTRAIKEAVSIPVMGAGYSYLRDGRNNLPGEDSTIKSFAHWAQKNLREGHTDMVGVCRQSLADPHFARKILEGSAGEIKWCISCNNCFRLVTEQQTGGCTAYDQRYKKLFRTLKRRPGVVPQRSRLKEHR